MFEFYLYRLFNEIGLPFGSNCYYRNYTCIRFFYRTYGLIADCIEKRLVEKCGEDVAEKAVEKMTKNIPENIREACTAQEYVEFSSHYGITGDKKK